MVNLMHFDGALVCSQVMPCYTKSYMQHPVISSIQHRLLESSSKLHGDPTICWDYFHYKFYLDTIMMSLINSSKPLLNDQWWRISATSDFVNKMKSFALYHDHAWYIMKKKRFSWQNGKICESSTRDLIFHIHERKCWLLLGNAMNISTSQTNFPCTLDHYNLGGQPIHRLFWTNELNLLKS